MATTRSPLVPNTEQTTKAVKPEVNFRFYFKLFWTTFALSHFTFGGGFVIISLMRKQMMVNLNWIDDEEMGLDSIRYNT